MTNSEEKPRLRPCPHCGTKVRDDRLLFHTERVHPRLLTAEEVAKLGRPQPASTPPQVRRVVALPRALGSAWAADVRSGAGGADAEDERGRSERPSLHEVTRQVKRLVARQQAGLPIGHRALEEADIAVVRLEVRCGDPLAGDDEEREQARFEAHGKARWEKTADPDPALVDARQRLFEADDAQFSEEFSTGLRERRSALSGPLEILQQAGEKGVPHLAVALMTDSWASLLAAEALAEMPPGPERDRALVEALFIRGDHPPEVAERACRTIPPPERWRLFEAIAESAREDGVELQSLYWTSLFEERTDLDDDRPERVLSEMGPALRALYDLGHHSALVVGLDFLLDPFVSGPERVEAVARDEGVRAFFRTVQERPPQAYPEGRKTRR